MENFFLAYCKEAKNDIWFLSTKILFAMIMICVYFHNAQKKTPSIPVVQRALTKLKISLCSLWHDLHSLLSRVWDFAFRRVSWCVCSYLFAVMCTAEFSVLCGVESVLHLLVLMENHWHCCVCLRLTCGWCWLMDTEP